MQQTLRRALLGLALIAPALARPAAAVTLDFSASAQVSPSAPQSITDLQAVSGSTTSVIEGRLVLTWTAPDAYTPTQGEKAGSYVVKYATFSAASLPGGTTAWWNTASFTVNITTPPLFPGSSEQLVLDRLETGATLYFSIRSINTLAPPQTSPIDVRTADGTQPSNVVPNLTPPQPLGLTPAPLCGQLNMSWTPVNSLVTYDFDRYRLFQSSVALGGPFENISSTGTRAVSYLTPRNLQNFTDYFYQIRSYDLQGHESTGTLSISTRPYPVPSVGTSLAVSGSSVTPTLLVTWANPTGGGGQFKAGILIKTTGLPLDTSVVDFSSYTVGSVLGNGEVVKKWVGNEGIESERFIDSNLAGGATYFYTLVNLYQQGSALCYSAPAAESIVLQPKPLPPSGIEIGLDSQFGFPELTWNEVKYFDSGILMHICGTTAVCPGEPDGFPPDIELAGYNVYKSTCGAGGCPGNDPPWEKVNNGGIIPKSSHTYIVGAPAQKTWYVVRAGNSFAFESANSSTIDSTFQLTSVALDGESVVAQVVVPEALKTQLKAANNPLGVDLTMNVVVRTSEQSGSTLRSIEIQVRRGDTGARVGEFTFINGQVVLSLSNTDVAGLSAAALKFAATPRPAAAGDLDIFWFNGVRYIGMNGDVNQNTQTVTVKTANTGIFQLRSTARALGFAFDPSADLFPRVITPNKDGLNDMIFFNTKVAGVTGKIFDIRGAKVADLKTCPTAPSASNYLCWDGTAGSKGAAVHGGIYIYDLNGQGTHFTGTVVVAQ